MQEKRRAFTLIELLVVISIIALLVGLLLPALSHARNAAVSKACIANIRTLEIAHTMYVNDHRGHMIDVGMGHGGSQFGDGELWWYNTLAKYYGDRMSLHSPGDKSPYWPKEEGGSGAFVPGSDGKYRLTSYGVNNYLSGAAPFDPWLKFDLIPMPSGTVHFLMMAEQGEYAGADHTHVENWSNAGKDNAPIMAAKQCEIHAHGGPEKSWDSIANWGFLDGHAETLPFREVYTDLDHNQFDPEVAR